MYSVWATGGNSMPIGNLTLTSINYLGISENLLSVINLVFLRVYPHFDSLNRDLVGILFLPEIGTTGVLILVPIFLVGLLSIPWLIKYKPGRFTPMNYF